MKKPRDAQEKKKKKKRKGEVFGKTVEEQENNSLG